MEVRSSFEIPASPDAAWALLMDVPRVIPCMPGAELVEELSDSRWRARLSTRLGPVNLGFDADVERESVDDDSRTVTLTATARERAGRGGARSRIVNRLEEDDSGRTIAHVVAEVSLSGMVARIGRQNLLQDVAAQMTEQFAANLRRELGAGEVAEGRERRSAAPRAPEAASNAAVGSPAPSAARMIMGILLRSVIRRFERLLERVEQSNA